MSASEAEPIDVDRVDVDQVDIDQDLEQAVELRDSLQGLLGLRSKVLSLDQMLTSVAGFAVQAIPGADGAGLTLFEHGRKNIIVATAEFVSQIDDIQYRIGQGPCISAAASGQTMRSGSLSNDPRWPKFGHEMARLGVHSAVSLPLIAEGTVLGAMNVYACARDVFDERAATLGEMYAVPAAISVQNAQLIAETQRLAARLQIELMNRRTIERAVGIMLSRSGGTADDALDQLRKSSQNDRNRIVAVAQGIIDEAVRRAGIRHIRN